MNPQPKQPEQQDLYKILEIDPGASDAEIDKAYKNLQRKYHPDSKLAGSAPDQEKFKQIGNAHEILSDPVAKVRYDRSYMAIQHEWNQYYRKLAAWKKRQQRQQETPQAEDRQKRKDKERSEQKRPRAESEEEEEQQQQWQERWKEYTRTRDQAEKEAAQHSKDQDEENRRRRWQEAQERTKEQAKRAEAAHKAAAEERLRKEKEQEQGRPKNPLYRSCSTTDTTTHQAAFSKRQREAAERERLVLEKARAERLRAAQDTLRRTNTNIYHHKRPHDTEDRPPKSSSSTYSKPFSYSTNFTFTPRFPFHSSYPYPPPNPTPSSSSSEPPPKRPKTEPTREYSSRIKKQLAREWARRKHQDHLDKIGGWVNRHKLENVIVDLGWQRDVAQLCDFCYRIGRARTFGVWLCPDGGAVACRPCLNALSTYGS